MSKPSQSVFSNLKKYLWSPIGPRHPSMMNQGPSDSNLDRAGNLPAKFIV